MYNIVEDYIQPFVEFLEQVDVVGWVCSNFPDYCGLAKQVAEALEGVNFQEILDFVSGIC